MVSKEIQSIRDQYKKETTLNHTKQGLGHTQYYSEWSEYKMVDQQQEIQRLQSTPTNNEIEDAKESLRLYQDSNCELSDEKIDGIIELIEQLKGEQWISVLDRLPLMEGHYLVHTPKSFPKNCKYQIGELYSDDNSWYNESDDYLDDVTHWCELPKAPEVG